MEIGRKHYLAGGLLLLIVLGFGFTEILGSENPRLCAEAFESVDNSEVSEWQNMQLVDISSCETYTVAELEKPVLVETFAVWCPTCTRQQQAVKEYHADSGVTSVSLDVDPNEKPQKVRDHVEQNGFDWRYSIAPSEMSRRLAEQYGNVMLNPPSAPMVLVCDEGTRKLPTGVKPPSKLQEEVEKGC